MNAFTSTLKGLLLTAVLIIFFFLHEFNSAKARERTLREQLKIERSQHANTSSVLYAQIDVNKKLEDNLASVRDLLQDLSIHPIIKAQYRITACFGQNRGSYTHKGTDLAVPLGTPIYAACDGELTVDYDDRSGYIARLHSEDGAVIHKFFHLREMSIPGKYKAGDIIAFSGNTGYSTGPHLHYEVWLLDGDKYKLVNPELLIPVFKRIKEEYYEEITDSVRSINNSRSSPNYI